MDKVQIVTDEKSSYRQIMKATSIFGGVQVFQIIISVIRSKFVALLLGPAGMGISGLLTSTTGFIASLTEFGLGTSAVRNIAEANGTGNEKRISTVVCVLRRLVWITGTLGALVTLVCSHWLSQLTFGNHHYTLAFIWLSVTLLFTQLSNGQMVLLQGMRKLQYLAKANLTGSIIGLLTTIPLYYFLGIDGIVPGIIIASISTLALSWYFSAKVKIRPVKVTKTRTIAEGKGMLTMGFMISLSGLFTVGASYIVRIFICRSGGVDQVGLYNAGFAIINTYVGLVFNAMGTDYYPRLSAVAHDNNLCKRTINQQAEIALLILAPIILVFMVFIHWVVVLLYSNRFIAINTMIYWAALGMFFKAASWAVAFVFLAKGANKLFFWNEFITNIYMLVLNIVGYHFWGLTGLGISFAVTYILYLIQVYVISKIKFDFSFGRNFRLIFGIQFSLAFCSFLVVKYLHQPYPYLVGMIFIIISAYYSFRELDKRLGIKVLVKNVQNKYHSSR